jgi:GDP-4-dehydro-6-deoxy-D-mannose reductase
VRALITGATGFVGPYLEAHLRACGDAIVIPGDVGGGFDIADRDIVHAAFAASQPEVVYHLAARSDVAQSWRDPLGTLRINVEGTQNVLDAARACGARRVLVVGSAEEYGPDDAVLREDHPLRPATPYGASKVAASFLALQAFLGSGLETIRVRPFSHTGPGQTDRFLVPALARRIAVAEQTDADTIAMGNTDPVRDLSDVRDVVRAYRLLMELGTPGDVYNVCRGVGISVGEIAARLATRATRPLRVVVDPELVRPVEVRSLVGDSTKLQQLTGWQPEYDVDTMLDDVLAVARRATSAAPT